MIILRNWDKQSLKTNVIVEKEKKYKLKNE